MGGAVSAKLSKKAKEAKGKPMENQQETLRETCGKHRRTYGPKLKSKEVKLKVKQQKQVLLQKQFHILDLTT